MARQWAKRIFRASTTPPLVVFVAVSAVVWWSWRTAISVLETDKSAARNEQIVEVSNTINDHLRNYEEILLSASGFFQSSSEVTLTEWARFLEESHATKNYSGAQGFGYIAVVSPQELPAFLADVRSKVHPDFNFRPEGQRDIYSAILYLEPQNDFNKRAIGFDPFSETNRSAAMKKAGETNKTVISKTVLVPKEGEAGEEKAFVMYHPIYLTGADLEKPKLSDLRGFTFAPFRAERAFATILSQVNNEQFALKIVEKNQLGTEEIFVSSRYNEISNKEDTSTTSIAITQYGLEWQVQFVFDEVALSSPAESSRPSIILGGGMLGALLLAFMVWLLIRTRTIDLAMQKEHEVNRAKDSLLSIASHQLRTPATGVKQYLGIVLQGFTGDISPAQADMLEKAYSSNERQLRVINEVLHLAKLDAGRIVLAKSQLDVSRLVRDIVHEVSNEVAEHGHKLKVAGLTKPVMIVADEHMLRMAVENLITNAIKYTPDNGVISVKLTTRRGFVDIAVKDNGVGIAADDRDKLYKQFARIPNSLSRKVSGTGVGLYLAKQLIELHGGDISLESTLNKGSTFTITIPKNKK